MVRPAPFGSVMTASCGTSIHPNVFGADLLRHAHPIVTAFGFPIGVPNCIAGGIRTAEALAACQMLEPIVEQEVSCTVRPDRVPALAMSPTPLSRCGPSDYSSARSETKCRLVLFRLSFATCSPARPPIADRRSSIPAFTFNANGR